MKEGKGVVTGADKRLSQGMDEGWEGASCSLSEITMESTCICDSLFSWEDEFPVPDTRNTNEFVEDSLV